MTPDPATLRYVAREPVVSALFVDPKGPYWTDPRCDCWGEERDARNYRGPLPVVAHPPCQRWCRLAKNVESRHPQYPAGLDGGCFASALQSVFRFGGVLEHPAFSLAWKEYELLEPVVGRWARATDWMDRVYWVTEVAQAAYGHPATKRTWLMYVGDTEPAPMNWERCKGAFKVGSCTRTATGFIRRNETRMGATSHISTSAFANALIELASESRKLTRSAKTKEVK